MKTKDFILKLDDIKDEGEEISFSSETHPEFHAALADLVPKTTVQLTLNLTPLEVGHSYQLNGSINTKLPLMCSRCAIEFNSPIQVKLNEIIMVGDDFELKGDRSVKSPHFSHAHKEGEPDVYFIKNINFNVGEFVHEMLALATPIAPLGRSDCDEQCPNLIEAYKKGWIEKPTSEEKKSPFDILKDFPLNH